jgi:hypothetical protein
MGKRVLMKWHRWPELIRTRQQNYPGSIQNKQKTSPYLKKIPQHKMGRGKYHH